MDKCGIYDLIMEWKASNQGFTAKGTKDGKKFFLKKYNNYTEPVRSPSMKDSLYNRLNQAFNDYKDYRIAINKALREVSAPGGNIIYPTHWFVDNHFFIEATEFVDGLIEEDDILRLSPEELSFVMMTAAAALGGVHRKKIVHSDLKRGNIVAARNSAGKIVAKLIDFDKSYFEDRLPNPDDLGGSQNYMSPELMNCMLCDFDDESLAALSTKSDIFSLGVVFYNYLANGDYPALKNLPDWLSRKPVVYPGEALCGDAKLVIEKSKIKEEYLRNLLGNMLQPKPENRPSASEVLEVLKSKRVMPLKDNAQIIIEGSSSEGLRHSESGRSTVAEAPRSAAHEGFCDPWPEHSGVRFDLDKLKVAGFVAMERAETGSAKVYALYKADGAVRKYALPLLQAMNWAVSGESKSSPAERTSSSPCAASSDTPAPAATSDPSSDATLWEDHADYVLQPGKITEAGYTFIGRTEKGGAHVYLFKTGSGADRVFALPTMIALGFVEKK